MSEVLRPPYSMHVFWSDEDQAYIAVSPEFDGLSAFGTTAERAAAELNDAIDAAIDVLREDGESLPAALAVSAHSGQFRLRLPRSLHARLAAEAEREGVSLNTLVVARLAASNAAERAARTAVDAVCRHIDSLRAISRDVFQATPAGGRNLAPNHPRWAPQNSTFNISSNSERG